MKSNGSSTAPILCPQCGVALPRDGSPCPHPNTSRFGGEPNPVLGDSGVIEPTRKSPQVKPGAAVAFASWDDSADEVTKQNLDSLVGMKLGEFQVVERFASGGMGVLYRGVHPVIEKPVVIKLLKDEYAADPLQMARLLEEARAVNNVKHRGIVDVFGFGQLHDGRGYVVMELLEGEPLDAVLKRQGRFTPDQAIDMMIELCGPIAAAHAAGVLHRDLKPANIFLAVDGDGTKHLKVLDFGLAKRTKASNSTDTAAGQIFGTPNYMAPEIVRQQPTGPHVDIYALGCILYEFLTGNVPYLGETPFDVMSQHVNGEIPRPSARVPGISPALDAIVVNALAKSPAARTPSVDAMRDALVALKQSAEEAKVESVVAKFRRRARNPFVVALLGSIIALAAAVALTPPEVRTVVVEVMVEKLVKAEQSASGFFSNQPTPERPRSAGPKPGGSAGPGRRGSRGAQGGAPELPPDSPPGAEISPTPPPAEPPPAVPVAVEPQVVPTPPAVEVEVVVPPPAKPARPLKVVVANVPETPKVMVVRREVCDQNELARRLSDLRVRLERAGTNDPELTDVIATQNALNKKVTSTAGLSETQCREFRAKYEQLSQATR